ncbi:small nuclear ribonucleoprotein G [Clonorchis sinensis]|uniref:Small nuclear ribonucleoprotein G n=1 Tax=Clonorchis sinensis TaxID=79923 RepID=G7YH12_CLOSI|nr:small nuclear ribonucleoprotein G [Clonorchis sinensis]
MAQSRSQWRSFIKVIAFIKLNGNREVIGTLRGFDAFMNIVINDAMEITKDGQQLRIDMAVIRGNSINIVEAIDRV